VTGSLGVDILKGDDAPNVLIGGEGGDQLFGRGRDDRLHGGPGIDTLRGDSGNDELRGGAGNDTLDGGPGIDRLFGGLDNDTFVFDVATSGVDIIVDGEFGPGPGDHVKIQKPGAIDTFAELMSHSSQSGSDVVIAFDATRRAIGPFEPMSKSSQGGSDLVIPFDATTSIVIRNQTIAQLSADDFLFA
jgi:Ca2+-binding RTX toxin-like protein